MDLIHSPLNMELTVAIISADDNDDDESLLN